jgi:tripartite-type tricarboxylate transporter receptor subunit TctC
MMMKYLLTVLLILTAHAVGAETYSVPTNLAGKTLQIIVPVTVGSTTDIVARVFAKTITEQVGDQMKVITMNRPGASGNIAIQSVVSSEPQSLTVCFCDNSTVIANPLLKMPNSIEFSDINIVSSIAEGYLILIAPGNAPYNTLPELIEYMKQNPKHNIIGAATATPALTAREIIDRGGLKDTEVIQYKGGSEAMLAVSRGDVPVAVTGIGDTAELVKAGKLKYQASGYPCNFSSMCFASDASTCACTGTTHIRASFAIALCCMHFTASFSVIRMALACISAKGLVA